VSAVPLPPVDSLRCFVAAAEHLNFRRAATEVALTPAALSQRIKQLEDMLGCVLFERSSRHVALTPAGQALLERARPALLALRACGEIGDASPSRVRFVLGTRFELGMSWIVPNLVDLRRERPEWHIDLLFGSSTEVLARLEQGQVDAIVTSAPLANADWDAEVLHPEAYVLVASAGLLARVPFATPQDAAHHTILDIDGALPLLRYALSVCPGLAFADLWRCGTGAAVHELARAGQGVAVLPLYMVRDDLERGRLQRLLPDIELLSDTFRLMHRKSSPVAETLRELAAWLRGRPLR
jgi:DNA-binding transcriptional LysR family regulator